MIHRRGRRGASIALLATALAAVVVGAPATAQSPAPAKSAVRSSEAVQAGREIYNRSCTMCHGQDGTAGVRDATAAKAAWTSFCRALFASAEFRYLN